jgi:thiamine kinase
LGGIPQADRQLVESLCGRLGLVDPSVTPLEGGSRNRSYRLADGRQDLVLRVDGEHDEAYAVTREAEYAAQRHAARHGLAPSLRLAGKGWSITEFVPGPPWSREHAASAAGAARAGEWLARLHALPVPAGLPTVRFLASLGSYANQLGDTDATGRIVEKGRRMARDLGEVTPVLCHNDLHHLNLIDSPRDLLAIDWEYAGAGDPRLDLAGYVAYHDLARPAVAALLESYAAHRSPCSLEELERARWLFESVWWAWLELRRELEGGEPEVLALARRRLLRRLTGSSGDAGPAGG